METLTCVIYINVSKLQYDVFLKKYQRSIHILNISNYGHQLTTTLSLCPLDYIERKTIKSLSGYTHMEKARPFRSGQKWMEKNGEEIEYNCVKGNLIISEQLVNILCEQNVEVNADQDRDNGDGDDDEGVEMTDMVDNVFEDESDED